MTTTYLAPMPLDHLRKVRNSVTREISKCNDKINAGITHYCIIDTEYAYADMLDKLNRDLNMVDAIIDQKEEEEEQKRLAEIGCDFNLFELMMG